MRETRIIRHICNALYGKVYQSLSVLFCVLFGLAMIANTQLAGEATWFWYAIAFHNGAKLYADLHLALQPLLVLEMDLWMKLFGIKCLVTEIPSVLHLLALCLGIFLLLRESDWPDWQKAVVLASAFVLWVAGPSYRFDDYHVTTESFIVYSLVMLLSLAKTDLARRQFLLAAAMGVLCGFAITSRINDGAALLVATSLCILVLAQTRKCIVCSLFVAMSALTAVSVVWSTGDTLSDYLSNSLFKAVGSKGGTSSIFADPFLMFSNALQMRHGGRWFLLWGLVIVASGALARLFFKIKTSDVVTVQLTTAGTIFIFLSHSRQEQLMYGVLIQFAIPFLVVVTYLLAPVLAARYAISRIRSGRRQWDAREILFLVPLAELASVATSAAGMPLSGYYSQLVMLLLLIPVIQPFRKQVSWANASLLTGLALVGLTGMIAKIHKPYSWDSLTASPMFVNRQWYRHPVYGPMYIERDLLQFSLSVCDEIGQRSSRPELLSLPLSYPNYFCDTPPWHGYVHTFFDTTTRSRMNGLMKELQKGPPRWIVYQRQLKSMTVLEQVFIHGQSFAQRDLDKMIMQKIATGQWQLVDKKNYMVEKRNYQDGDGWYVVRTRP